MVHIEGSLGQVAVSTCYSPRRAIGAVYAVQVQGPVDEQKDIRQQRLEVLSKIEKVSAFDCVTFPWTCWPILVKLQLFIVLLEVEELDRLKTTVLSETEEKRLTEEKQKKVDHIYSQVQHHNPQWVSPHHCWSKTIILFNLLGLFHLSSWFLLIKHRDTVEEFLPFLLVAKGKRLVARLLPFLKRDAALNILRIVTSNLPLLINRDTEEVKA